jgi:2-methylisocitrate lyase-like PEP mutase family enzyme
MAAEAIEQAQAYAAAGVDGIFVPGLSNETLIARVWKPRRCPSTS